MTQFKVPSELLSGESDEKTQKTSVRVPGLRAEIVPKMSGTRSRTYNPTATT